MPSSDLYTSKKITKTIFWFNHTRRLASYSVCFSFSSIVWWAFFNTDPDIILRIFAFSFVALTAVLIPVYFILRSAYKRHMAFIENNADVRTFVADYLANNITMHRYGHENFYVKSLIKTGDSRTTLCLAILLKSIFPGRREYAVKTLGKLGGEKAIELLKAAIDDKNYDVSEAAKKAYANLTEGLQ